MDFKKQRVLKSTKILMVRSLMIVTEATMVHCNITKSYILINTIQFLARRKMH